MRCTITFALIGLALVSGFGGLRPVAAAGPFQRAESKTPPAKAAAAKTGTTPSAEKADQLFSIARLSERQGQLAEARTMYVALLDKFPEHRDAIHRLGAIAVRSGDTDVALEHLGRAEEIGPPTAELLSDIGYALYLQDRLPLAEQKLRAALSMNPQYVAARNNLGIVLAEQRKFDAALAEFRKAGNEAKAYCNLAYVQTKVGALAEAERNYHKALELDGSCKRAAEALIQFESAREKAKRITAAKGHAGPLQPDDAGEVALASTEEAEPTVMEAPEGEAVEFVPEESVRPSPPVVIEDAPRPMPRAKAPSKVVAKPSGKIPAVTAPQVMAPAATEEAPGESLADVLRKARRASPEETPAELKGTPAPAPKKAATKNARPPVKSRVNESTWIERSVPIPRVEIPSASPTGEGAIANPYAQSPPAKAPPAEKKATGSKPTKSGNGPVVVRTDG